MKISEIKDKLKSIEKAADLLWEITLPCNGCKREGYPPCTSCISTKLLAEIVELRESMANLF